MDDSLHDLEAELKTLPLARPSARLFAGIERSLSAEDPTPLLSASRPATARRASSPSVWFLWPAIGLAAALVIVATVGLVRSRLSAPPVVSPSAPLLAATPLPVNTATSTPDTYEPVDATNVLYDLRDEGPASMDDGASGRLMRYRYLDTYTWKNPHNNGSLKWSVPRDEIRVIPASLH